MMVKNSDEIAHELLLLKEKARLLSESLNDILANPVARSLLGEEKVSALRKAAYHAGFAFGEVLTANGA